MKKKVLAIIPARGGSKGVKRKNIRPVGGMPLIYWSIKASCDAITLNKTYLTTDDAEISRIGIQLGAKVIERPDHLAEDKTPMLPVLEYVLDEAEKKNGRFDVVVLLQPTAPMRTSIDIDSAVSVFLSQNNAKSLVSVYQVEDCHPSRMYRLVDGKLEKVYAEPTGSLRQDLEPIYHRNGAIYICDRDFLKSEKRLTCDKPFPFIMPKDRSANIDDEQDLAIADFLMSSLNSQ